MNVLALFKEILRGKDAYRILMNAECARFTLHGKVLDIGSGTTTASYYRFFKTASGAVITPLDIMAAGAARVDFERDPLPEKDASVDAVLAFNVFEHVYNYAFLAHETFRVLKSGGRLIGAVPFLVGYHADPHDFWRYTHETLFNVFKAAGFLRVDIVPIARGPFTAAWLQVDFMMPRIIKLFAVPAAFCLDRVFRALFPKMLTEKFALGFFFVAGK